MASRGPPPNSNSKLGQMQIRYQQRQKEERERKEAIAAQVQHVHSIHHAPPANKVINNGRVRQMFDDRRRGAGIDRSNPLKPLAGTAARSTAAAGTAARSTAAAGTAARSTAAAGTAARFKAAAGTAARSTAAAGTAARSTAAAGTAARSTAATGALSSSMTPRQPTVPSYKAASPPATYSGYQRMTAGGYQRRQSGAQASVAANHNFNVNGNTRRRMSQDGPLLKGVSSLSLKSHQRANDAVGDRNNNNRSPLPTSRGNMARSSKLNPVITKKSPPIPLNRGAANCRSPSSPPLTMQMLSTAAGSRAKKVGPKAAPLKISMSFKPPAHSHAPPDGMSTCRYCGRNFYNDRLSKHETVCQKMATTKRKIFDASKQRTRGTDSEKYQKKSGGSTTTSLSRAASTYTSAAAVAGITTGVKKSNWRRKHEEFINAIRSAKKVQAYVARGGKLSDLPPPPPSENPDYIQCPHCMRRFNEAAAERHIPKCANMLHNKPKPPMPKKR